MLRDGQREGERGGEGTPQRSCRREVEFNYLLLLHFLSTGTWTSPFADCSRAPCAVDTPFSPRPAHRLPRHAVRANQRARLPELPRSVQVRPHQNFINEQKPMCPSVSISASNNLSSHCCLSDCSDWSHRAYEEPSPAASPWPGLTMQVLKVLHCPDPRRTPTSQSYTQQSYLEVAMTDMQHRAPGHMSGHAGGWGRGPETVINLGVQAQDRPQENIRRAPTAGIQELEVTRRAAIKFWWRRQPLSVSPQLRQHASSQAPRRAEEETLALT